MYDVGELESLLAEAEAAGDEKTIVELTEILTHPYYAWTPRPDNPGNFDEQTSFCYGQDAISCLVSGNAAGKSDAAAWRVAHLVCEWQPPPRKRTPLWVISDTYEMACGMGWVEKLSRFIPSDRINWPGISWLDKKKGWPSAVPLKPWPGSVANWVLEFKSYEQGRTNMQARSIGGFWFSEQFPWEIFLEVYRGCRDYAFPGCQIMEFTPVDPGRSAEIQEIYEKWQVGDELYQDWGFYRLNTLCNTSVSEEWKRIFLQSVSEEMRPTRTTGEFASYEGSIYPTFDPRIHCRNGLSWKDAVLFRRGVDWGASAEHPLAVLWMAQMSDGQWRVFDEYRSTEQVSLLHHIEVIKARHPWPKHDARYGTCWADSADPANIMLFLEAGIPTMGAWKEVLPGIETVRKHLGVNPGTGQPGLLIDRDHCPHLVREMQTYRWLRSTKPGHAPTGLNPQAARPEPLKKFDDLSDTLRYILASEERQRGITPDSLRAELRQRPGLQMTGMDRVVKMRREGGGLFPKRPNQSARGR